jgi:hypothetical protein
VSEGVGKCLVVFFPPASHTLLGCGSLNLLDDPFSRLRWRRWAHEDRNQRVRLPLFIWFVSSDDVHVAEA